MNNLLFIALIIVLLYYFFYYLPRQKLKQVPPKLTHSQGTQTDLSDKQITNLIQQWNQVVEWAKEEGIDVNKKWNLNSLKKKVQQKTQSDSQLENTLDSLIKDIQDLNKKL
ncbi:MAG: hypothetical protein MRERV_4c070 [Mycoplasmataceae bacterium RV_VA103A]|nr:MAG: hypothetical protein MRERV_11c028 [Mycoplasmataceae bacterium RV_VA103A]KLL05166.1 MAG: hypothetical protein MRERV_4c070 [Mycoplasmataceae bacterium RV_VA103A]